MQFSKLPPEPKPRPALQLLGRSDQEVGFAQAASLQNVVPRRPPTPRPANVEVLPQRTKSVRVASRSPRSTHSGVTGAQVFPAPPQDLPPGQWDQEVAAKNQEVVKLSKISRKSGTPRDYKDTRPFSIFPVANLPTTGTQSVLRPPGVCLYFCVHSMVESIISTVFGCI